VSVRAAFALVLIAVLAAVAVPWSDGPLRRLAGGEGDGPEPTFDLPLDPAPLQRAGAALRDDTRYETSAPDESPLVQGNLKAAAQLYLSRQLPVHDAPLVFGYRNGRITTSISR
jgi:hypothetical protein